MIEHVSSCRREHPQGKYLINGNPVVICVLLLYLFLHEWSRYDMIYLNLSKTNREKQKSSRKVCLVCFVFSRSCLCCFLFVYVFFDCKCKSLNRLGENIVWLNKKKTERNRNKTEMEQTSFEKNKKNRNTGYPALDPTAKIYIYIYIWYIFAEVRGLDM